MPWNRENNAILRTCFALLALSLGALCASVAGPRQTVQDRSGDRPSENAGPATLQGVVRDSEHRPVAGATISLQANDAQPITARSDSSGAYRCSTLHEGVYTLHAVKAGYLDSVLSAVVVGRSESKTLDLTLVSARASDAKNSFAAKPEFFDEPNFTVAGVTDTTSPGGHGSSTTLQRSQEALAKETAALRKPASDDRSDALAAPHHALAENLERQGKPLEAVREYQRAAELNPSESNIFDWGSELLLHRATEPAVEVFTKGHRLFPQSVRMLTGLGAAWYSAGSFDEAVQRLCEASDLKPAAQEPYLFMGEMQVAAPTASDAIAERLERFTKLQPGNAMANYYFAVTIWKQRSSPDDTGKLAQVKSLLEEAIHLDPKLGPAYLQLGILYSEKKDLPHAISAYQKAMEADPLLEQSHYRLAQAYRQAGKESQAHDELALYEKISKEKAGEAERQRHDLQRFVYELRDQPAAQQK